MNYLIKPACTLFIMLSAAWLQAQTDNTPVALSEVRVGDEVIFSEGPDAKRFVIIGKESETLSCSILNEAGTLDTVVVRKSTVVQAYKNSLNRKRMSIFQPGVKLRWKQRGQRVEGFLKHYSPADPELTIEVYTSDKLEERRVPAQYASPTFGESMADTMRWLCQVWEAPEQLLSYDPKEDSDQGIPRMEYISLATSKMKSKFQYVMEDYRFAMVFKENLNQGIVGSWRVQDDLIIVSTKMAFIKGNDGKRKSVPCAEEYRFEYEIGDRGNSLKLTMVDWDKYELFWEQKEEEQRAREEAERMADEPQDQEFESLDPAPAPTRTSTTSSSGRLDEVFSRAQAVEIRKLKNEIEALKREVRRLKEELQRNNG